MKGKDPALELAEVAEPVAPLASAKLEDLFSKALALVVPNVEEFGIAAVESQAAGRPVLAADGGGVRETVLDGETGVLLPQGDVRALAECMRVTDFSRFSPDPTRAHAQEFGPHRFRERAEVERARVEDGFADRPSGSALAR